MDELCRDTIVVSPPAYHQTHYSPLDRLKLAQGRQVDVDLTVPSQDDGVESPIPRRRLSREDSDSEDESARDKDTWHVSDWEKTPSPVPSIHADFTIPSATLNSDEVRRSSSRSSQPAVAPPMVTKVEKQTGYVKPSQLKRRASTTTDEGPTTTANKKKSQVVDHISDNFNMSTMMEHQRELLQLKFELREKEREAKAKEKRAKWEFKLKMKEYELEVLKLKSRERGNSEE